MKRLLLGLGLVGLAVTETRSASADFTVGQKKFIKKYDKYMKRQIDAFKEACGYDIEAKYDWKSFQKQIQLRLDGDAATITKMNFGYCEDPIAKMISLCREDKDYKAAVKAKVKRYVCQYGGDAKTAKAAYKKRKLKISGGVLTFHHAWLAGDSTFPKFIKKFFENNL